GACDEAPASVTLRLCDRPLEELRIAGDGLPALLVELAMPRSDALARIVLRGRAGSGRRTVAAALAARAGRALGLVEVRADRRGEPSEQRLAQDLREAHLRGWLPCVSSCDAPSDDPTVRARLRAVLDAHPGPLFVRVDPAEMPPLAAGHLTLDLPVL